MRTKVAHFIVQSDRTHAKAAILGRQTVLVKAANVKLEGTVTPYHPGNQNNKTSTFQPNHKPQGS